MKFRVIAMPIGDPEHVCAEIFSTKEAAENWVSIMIGNHWDIQTIEMIKL